MLTVMVRATDRSTRRQHPGRSAWSLVLPSLTPLIGTAYRRSGSESVTRSLASHQPHPATTPSPYRSPERTDIARFWSTNAVVQYNTAFTHLTPTRGLDAVQAARRFAMGNLVGAER